jgi:hypothetical protein
MRSHGSRSVGVGHVDRLVVDVGSDGQVGVSVQLDGDLTAEPVGERVGWAAPLDARTLEDVRWYLEDYLRAPFAVYEQRGTQVVVALAGYGEALFSSVFGAGAARDAYMTVQARSGTTEVVLHSVGVGVLGLPWELTRDPGQQGPLVLDDVAITRMLPSQPSGSRFEAVGDRLRVLMMIARPAAERDVGYQMVARRLLPLLAGVRGPTRHSHHAFGARGTGPSTREHATRPGGDRALRLLLRPDPPSRHPPWPP